MGGNLCVFLWKKERKRKFFFLKILQSLEKGEFRKKTTTNLGNEITEVRITIPTIKIICFIKRAIGRNLLTFPSIYLLFDGADVVVDYREWALVPAAAAAAAAAAEIDFNYKSIYKGPFWIYQL